ncbi:SAM-dependent DNA methyltransferase [Butyricicoccus sp. OF10-2]|nr:SAM-dependent DNA methyltransferase [Butyricicoccus sp. OF10-2]
MQKPKDYPKKFLKTFQQLSSARHHPLEVWQDFVLMAACALSNPLDKEHFEEREKRYLQTIRKYNKQEQGMFPELLAQLVMALENNSEQDFLGEAYMRLNLSRKTLQQIFTPYHVCQMMAAIVMGNITKQVENQGYITINDPCCGGGATLIAGVHEAKHQLEKANLNYQNHVLVVAQDIDETVALMCYIQLSLLGVAGYVKVGNSLTEPMASGDTTKNYWFTPMYFANVWTARRMLQNTRLNETISKIV